MEFLKKQTDNSKQDGQKNAAKAHNSMETAVKRFNFFRTEWVNRKRKCMDVIDVLSDGMNKKPKDVIVSFTFHSSPYYKAIHQLI